MRRGIGYAEFREFLAHLGVCSGDTIMVHSFLAGLGPIDDGLDALFRSLLDQVGPRGTLVVPTFTYSFCRGEVFHAGDSPSTVGQFTEYVRSQRDAVRSEDPLFSIAAVGDAAQRLTCLRRPVCFGQGSVFETLEEADAKFLLLGVDYSKALTYFIHLEKLVGVPYREDKVFEGILVDKEGRARREAFTYYVRTDPGGTRMDYNRVGFRFDDTALGRKSRFGRGEHRLVRAADLRDFALPHLQADPFCLVHPSSTPASDARCG